MDQRPTDRSIEAGTRRGATIAFAGWKRLRVAVEELRQWPHGPPESFTNLLKRRAAWLEVKPGRRIVLRKSPRVSDTYRWMALLEEDDRGIIQVRGLTFRDALRQALSFAFARSR